MRILLTNDDGIEAPGLAALERAARQIGEVLVVAPDRPLSGVSHQVTTDRPVAVRQLGEARYALAGTPADCVRLALTQLATDIDWVFSGINDGGNLGVDIYMSGTVAAAREAALMGVPAVAWSQYVKRPEGVDWQRSAEYLSLAWQRIQATGLPARAYWNVNFPHGASLDSAGPHLCAPDPHPLPIDYRQEDSGYHYRGKYAERPQSPGRDVAVCFGGRIAISKVVLEPT